MSWREEDWRQSPEERADGDAGESAKRPAPGRRSLTQSFGRAAMPGATPGPGKVSLTHRLRESGGAPQPMALPYRDEMEASFGQDFAAVSAVSTDRAALGGSGGMAQGESVAFAGATPSRQTVAHELAHVVQHRRGETGGQALAENGTTPLDVVADKMAGALTAFNKGRARLPRPVVIEVLGDRFEIAYRVNAANQLVFVVRYQGPYEVAGDKVKERTIEIATPRADEQLASDLDVSLVSVHERGAVFDLSGTSAEIAELTFRPQPHPTDGNARCHQLLTRTNDKAGESRRGIFQFDILLPSADRPAPAGVDAGELARERTWSAPVNLGPDTFTLVARRFGESDKVHVHFEGAGAMGEKQDGIGNLLVPIGSPEGPVTLDVLEQALGGIALDLDGDGQLDVRLVHTASTGDLSDDGSEQDHLHYIDAYDRHKVRVAHAFIRVPGAPWEVPEAIDNHRSPPPDSALPPADRDPLQGDLPTEGAQPIKLDSDTDWELRVDADGDRRKELLLRFHQEEAGAPVTITAVQVSSAYSSRFAVETIPTQTPLFMDPVLVRTGDGLNPAEVKLYTRGHYVHIWIAPPSEDAEGRIYTFACTGPGGRTSESIRFPAETVTGNPLAAAAPTAGKTVAGIRSVQVRLGELADPFLFTLEHAPGGLTLGIAGLDPSGAPGSTSGHRLDPVDVTSFDLVSVTSTRLGIDLTGDGTADLLLHDAIGQEVGPVSTRSLLVARYHQMTVSGPAVAGGSSTARFDLRGKRFLPTSEGDAASREGAGAACAVVSIGAQLQEGNDVDQLIARFRAGVSAQLLRAGERGFVSSTMVSSFKALSEEMIRLAALAAAPADRKAAVASSLSTVRMDAAGNAAILFGELEAATTGEVKRHPGGHADLPDTFSNPYTGAGLDEIPGKSWGDGHYDPPTYKQISPAPAASLSAALLAGDDARAASLWPKLQDGVERWAQARLERELGAEDPLVKQGSYLTEMATQLDEIKSRKRIMRVPATFIADESYRKEQGFFPSLPLQLWVWQDDDEETWRIRDLTSPDKPFEGAASSTRYQRNCNPAVDRPAELPPHALFQQLDHEHQYPKGLIRYQIAGTEWADQVVCHAEMEWYQWVQYISLGLAGAGLVLASFGTAVPVLGIAGSYVLAGSAVAGAVAAGGELADAAEHGWLDGTVVMVNLLQIAGSAATAGAIVARTVATTSKVATDVGRLAAMAGKYYVPLTGVALATDVTSLAVMGLDLKNKLAEIDAALPEGDERDDAKVKLLSMAALTGGLTVLSVKGDLPALRGDTPAPLVLDTMGGVPVAHVGGVRAGGVEIDVSPRIGPDGLPVVDPNLHASARWQTRDASVAGLTESELPWYRAWMEQGEKVRFKPGGEPEVIMPRLEGTPPAGLEAKLAAMVKTTDVALYDAAWARSAELDELRAANGGHLDIDPTSPMWPAERAKLKEKLERSLGSARKAEEMLARYEQFRGGANGAGEILHANQAAKLSQVIPPGEVDSLRQMFPECEVYVSGAPVRDGAATKIDTIEVVVVVPGGTSPDLMAAIEARASAARLRPDPDYAKAHAAEGMNESSTLGVRARAVTSEQFFGLTTVQVAGRQPIELHRLDVPTDPSGRAYSPGELEAMHKAGYEYDPASGQFVLRDAASRAGLLGSGRAVLRGDNTVIGSALPSEAIGQEVLRKLAMGDAEAFRVVGVEPGPDFDPRVKEWGLGQREDGTWVLVEGQADAVNWDKLPGVKPRGHAHPLELEGEKRHIEGPAGRKYITIDELTSGSAPPAAVMALCPSGSDLAMAHKEGRHLVATPYVHLGNGMLGNPTPGGLDVPVEFDILSATPVGVSAIGRSIFYKAYVKVRAGDQVLYQGPMWGAQVDLGTLKYSDVGFKEPIYPLKPVPEGTPRGAWRVGGGGAAPSATGSNADEIAAARAQTVDERRQILGTDPTRGYLEHEALVGAEIEAAHGWFKRDPTPDGEWISLTTGKSYDLCGFPARAIAHVKVSQFTASIRKHFLKSIDYIVVDIRGLPAAKQTEIKDYIAAHHAGEGVYPSGRLLLLE